MREHWKQLLGGSSFLLGFMLALDFSGRIGQDCIDRLSEKKAQVTDSERMRGYWQTVGNDIRYSMEQVHGK